MQATCPGHDVLRDFRLGKLPADIVRGISEHLETCPNCLASIETISDSDDTLVQTLRQPPPADGYQDEPDMQKAVAAVQALGTHFPSQTSAGGANTKVDAESLGALRDYQLLEMVGEGGMGRVYKAQHQRLKRTVAVKLLPKGRTRDKRAVARFEREMEAVGKLEHPNIIRALDAGEHDGIHYLVMEFVDGIDLSQAVTLRGPMCVADACELVRQAADGLQCAHEHGLVHRDIKPSNLMLTAAGEVKVLDLGLALLLAEQPGGKELTDTSQMMGTADYCAPEQAGDSHTVDIRADIYSLGCTLYKLLTGHVPFSGDLYNTTMKKLMAHTTLPVPAIRGERPDVPDGLTAVLDRMLAKDPVQRYGAPAEVMAAIAPYAKGADLERLFAEASSPLEVTEARSAPTAETTPYLSSAMTGTRPSEEVQLAPAYVDAATETYAGERPRRRGLVIAATAALVLLAGIVIIIRNKEGIIISQTEVGHDATVDVEDGSGKKLLSTTTSGALPDSINREKAESPSVPDFPLIAAFDHLRSSTIPPYELSAAAISDGRPAPRELVAVFGDSRLRHWAKVNSVGLADNGRAIVSCSEDGTARLWDIKTLQQRCLWRFPAGARSVAVSPDGNTLAVGVEGEPFHVYDIASQREIYRAARLGGAILAWSPDGSRLASVSEGGDGTVDLWDALTGRHVHHLGEHRSPVRGVAFNNAGTTLASGSDDTTMRLWDLTTFDEVWSVRLADFPICAVAFDPDGRLLASSTTPGVKVLDSNSGAITGSLEANGSWHSAIATGLIGDRVAIGGIPVEIFDQMNGKLRQRLVGGESLDSCLAATANGKTLVTGNGDGWVRIWNAESEDGDFEPAPIPTPAYRISLRPDGQKIAAASYNGTVRIWDVKTQEETLTFSAKADVLAVTYSPDGRHIVTGHHLPYVVRIWDAESGQMRRELPSHGNGVSALAFALDGKILLTGSYASLRAWDPVSGNELRTPFNAEQSVTALDTSSDGHLYAVSGKSSSNIKIGEASTGNILKTLRGHVGGINSLAFSPDSTMLVSPASEPDASVRLWDMATGEEIRSFRDDMRTALFAAFSPDGKTIASASGDGKVRLWDPDPPRGTPALKRTIQIGPSGGMVRQVHWTPDGRHLVTLNGNGTVYVLRLDEKPARS